MPEWDMEKYRFYVDLPGDVWERGDLMRLIKVRCDVCTRRGGEGACQPACMPPRVHATQHILRVHRYIDIMQHYS